ncbi:hypothetical protein [Caldalkalibacillus mannanilyticus]|uniref:hypothetical protein n=1 Tax=Caldalkalibacillus mannanilyticus TaxID=1418 RepID=UPI000468AB48|nr:hypothetical protein [Caldalkalibacillus mannanilyticus]
MDAKRVKPLLLIKTITTIGLMIGFVISMLGLFESGLRMEYMLSIGMSFMVSSMLLFGFGMFIPLMEEVSEEKEAIREK